MEIQRLLGSDIAMAFDECPPAGVEPAKLEDAVRRTSIWAERCRACEPAPGQLVFGICQGGIDLALRRAERRAHRLARLRRPRDRRADGGREPRGDVRDHARDRRDAAGRAAALLHGDRGSRGRDRGRSRRASTCSTASSRRGSGAPARRSSPAAGSTSETPPTPTTSARSRRAARASPAPTFSRAYIRHLITQERDRRPAPAHAPQPARALRARARRAATPFGLEPSTNTARLDFPPRERDAPQSVDHGPGGGAYHRRGRSRRGARDSPSASTFAAGWRWC